MGSVPGGEMVGGWGESICSQPRKKEINWNYVKKEI